jgi:hypothetical protein
MANAINSFFIDLLTLEYSRELSLGQKHYFLKAPLQKQTEFFRIIRQFRTFMALEVSDCTASYPDYQIAETPFEPRTVAAKGIGSFPDSIHIHPATAPKPNLLKRIAISISLLFLHMTTWSIQFTNWVLKTFFNFGSRQKILYRELHHISKHGDVGKIEEFLVEHSEESFAAGYLFSEFMDLPELYSYFPEILQGANVCMGGDNGFFCRRWSEHAECYQRISSHEYQHNQCFAIGHFLFWLDLQGNTRFQFENSQLRGFFSWINHVIDYLRYRRDNEQQGVIGSSPHTEDYCLRVEVDPSAFISRKLN